MLALAGCQAGLEPGNPTQSEQQLRASLARLLEQPTPFQPLAATALLPSPASLATQPPTAAPTTTPVFAAPPTRRAPSYVVVEPSLEFHGIDFASRKKVTITIYPPNRKVNRGKPIRLSFIPAENCRFGTRKACAYAYKPTLDGNVIILTVHSGVGGQAQALRHALEGTGINRAGLSLEVVQRNLKSLSGAQVTIEQGDRQVKGVFVDGLVRIPARALERYFRVPLAKILNVAADIDGRAEPWVETSQPILVIETCGWKMSGEAGSQNVSDTTGSVYLTVIR